MSGLFRSQLRNLMRSGSLSRSIGVLASGTVIAQAIGVLALPVLTRIYAPEDFDLLALFSSLLAMLSVVGCLRLNIAIPIPEKSSDAANLLVLSLTSCIVWSCIISIPFVFFATWTSELMARPDLDRILWLLPVGVFLATSYDALQYWATRKRRYGLVSRTRIARALGGTGAQLGLGAQGVQAFGLIFGHVVMNAMGLRSLIVNFYKHDRRVFQHVSLGSLKKTAQRFARFPLLSTPEALLNTAGLELSILLISVFAAGPEAGYLILALRVMGIPMTLVGVSIGQVYLTEASLQMRQGNLAKFTRSFIRRNLMFGGPAFVALGLLAPTALPFILGEGWDRTGDIILWMTPMFILNFMVSPVSFVFQVAGRLRAAVALQFIGLIIRSGGLIACIFLGSQFLTAYFAASGAVFYAIYLWAVLRIADTKSQSAWGHAS